MTPLSAKGSTKSKAGKTGMYAGKTMRRPFTTGHVAPTKHASYSNDYEVNTMPNFEYNNPRRFHNFEVEDGFDKVAASFLEGLGKTLLPAAATAAVGGLVSFGLDRGLEAYRSGQTSRQADMALQQAISMSPRLQGYGYETLHAYMPMIIKASPTVATEPRLLANYLESMLDAEGHLNLSTFRELTDLEGGILKNHDYRNSMRNKFMEGVGKGSVDVLSKGVGSTVSNYFK